MYEQLNTEHWLCGVTDKKYLKYAKSWNLELIVKSV
jgi:hypothetical protein